MAISVATEYQDNQSEENPYLRLGVRKWATDQEVKMAYIRMVKRYNPEAFPDKFIQIRKAYEHLRTPARRAKVDILVFNEIKGGIGYKNVELSTESLVKLNRQVEEFEKAEGGAPTRGDARVEYLNLRRQRSIGYAEKGMWHEALDEWEKIVVADRSDRESRRNLVVGHSRLAYQLACRERHDEAVVHWEKALANAPDSVEIIHNLAIAATLTGKTEKQRERWVRTLALWNERLKKDPESAYLQNLIVETHKFFGGEFLNTEKSSPAQKAPAGQPAGRSAGPSKPGQPPTPAGGKTGTVPSQGFDSFTASKELGIACMDRKNWQAAIHAFNKCLAEQPESVEILNYLGWANLNAGEVDEAFRLWNKALKIEPGNKETRDNLVRAHLKVAKHLENQRVWAPALVHLKSVLSLDPKNAEVYARLGNVYKERGDTISAIEHWQKVLELDPKNRHVRNQIRRAKQGMLR
jgi:tetratricopeptide (TPR) repeat protein